MGRAQARSKRKPLRNVHGIDAKHKKLASKILLDVSTLLKARSKLPYDIIWVDAVNSLLRGDPPPNSATISFPASGGVTVTVTVEPNRTSYAVFASPDPDTLGNASTELATSSFTPFGNQLGGTIPDEDYSDEEPLLVQLTFVSGSGREQYEVEFTQPQVAAGNTITLGMSPV